LTETPSGVRVVLAGCFGGGNRVLARDSKKQIPHWLSPRFARLRAARNDKWWI